MCVFVDVAILGDVFVVRVTEVDSLGMLPINLSKYKKLYSQIIKNVFTKNTTISLTQILYTSLL